MEQKRVTWLLAIVGSYAGSYLPLLWGAEGFSFSALVTSALGAILGIWIAFKITR
jgi:uncharacterized membrane protein YeaQ/YmgE (transglycosylase-associated protein family)